MLNTIPNKKKKALIISGASFLLVIACAGVVWVDWKEIKKEQADVESLRMQIDKADARIRKIPEIELRVLRERSIVRENVKILPSDAEINEFVEKITEFASSSGVEVVSLDEKSARDHAKKKSAEIFARIVYKMKIMGTVSQFLDFLNRFETHDRFCSINQFTIKGGKKDESKKAASETQVVRHEIELEVETYVYNARASGEQPVEILNADQKLAKVLRAEEIANALTLDSYTYSSKPERRDPFVDPRISEQAGNTAPVAENAEAQEKMLDELRRGMAELNKALAEEMKIDDIVTRHEYTKRLNLKLIEFETHLKKLDSEKFFSSKELAGLFKSDVHEPMARIMKDRPSSAPGFEIHEIESQLGKMGLAFEQGRFQDVVTSAATLLGSKSSSAPEEVVELFSKVEFLKDRAQARIEFGQKPIRFSGVVYVRNNPKSAVVIINDRAYSPGDVMDDGVVIRSVDPAQVTFLYKKEEIAKALE